MPIYKIYERAFHPDKHFGLGGMGFKGDNRGYSFMLNATARVWSVLSVNTQAPTLNVTQDSSQFDVFSDASVAPGFLGGRTENYASRDTRPTGTARVSGGPSVPDGLQSITIRIETRGINHAFPTEYISDLRDALGVDELYRRLGGGDIPMNPESRMLVPDLDVQVALTLLIDLHKKKITITSNLTGDGFPNTEVFIYDQAGTPLMLNTHHRIGTAAGQLVGNHRHLLASSVLTVDIDGAGNFKNPVKADRSVDFMPWDRDLLAEAGTTDFDIATWNSLHLARVPTETGIFGLDTDDNLPIPGVGHMWPRDRRYPGVRNLLKEPTIEQLPHWNK